MIVVSGADLVRHHRVRRRTFQTALPQEAAREQESVSHHQETPMQDLIDFMQDCVAGAAIILFVAVCCGYLPDVAVWLQAVQP